MRFTTRLGCSNSASWAMRAWPTSPQPYSQFPFTLLVGIPTIATSTRLGILSMMMRRSRSVERIFEFGGQEVVRLLDVDQSFGHKIRPS
jgi:hypothetical protein